MFAAARHDEIAHQAERRTGCAARSPPSGAGNVGSSATLRENPALQFLRRRALAVDRAEIEKDAGLQQVFRRAVLDPVA